MDSGPVEVSLLEAERIAYAYRIATRGDAWAALVRAIHEALTDLAEAERRMEMTQQQISHRYVRGRFDRPGQ